MKTYFTVSLFIFVLCSLYKSCQADFSCLSGTKVFSMSSMITDLTEEKACEVQAGVTPKCYQLLLEMTMTIDGEEYSSKTYKGGCFYPGMPFQSRKEVSDGLFEDTVLDKYELTKCKKKNCFDLMPKVKYDCSSNNGAGDCQNGATCSSQNGLVSCLCTEGWGGPFCGDDINECTANDGAGDCMNAAACVNTIGSFECTCEEGWHGPLCQDRSFTCLSGVRAYSMGSLISDTTDEELCTLKDGVTPECYQISIGMTMTLDGEEYKSASYKGGCYYSDLPIKTRDQVAGGLDDDTVLDNYDVAKCGSSNCFDLQPTVKYDCSANGGAGDCKNGATCSAADGLVKCACTEGWGGPFCEDDINECTANDGLGDCLNEAVCVNTIGSFTCECENGWEGQTCNKKEGPKVQQTSSGYSCVSGVKAFSVGSLVTDRTEEVICDTRVGVTPKCYQLSLEMTMTIDGEKYTSASYKGGCYYPDMKLKSQQEVADGLDEDTVLDNYDFKLCSQKNCFNLLPSVKYDCSANGGAGDCKNGATCSAEDGLIKCVCTEGWGGPFCGDDINECTVNTGAGDCLNGAKCINTVGSFECECTSGWQGKLCDQASFTCLSGVKAFSMGSLITDRSEEESCDARDGVAPKCYQITIELTMTMDGEDYKSSSYKGGCHYQNSTFKTREEVAAGLQEDTTLDRYDISYCNDKNCFNLLPQVKYGCSANGGAGDCKNGATCSAEDGLIKCACTEGWGGPFCGDDINECTANDGYGDCANRAMCKNTMGSFTCECKENWSGKLCDEGDIMMSENDEMVPVINKMPFITLAVCGAILLIITIIGLILCKVSEKKSGVVYTSRREEEQLKPLNDDNPPL